MKTRKRHSVTTERDVLRVNLRKGSVESLRDEVVVEGRMELHINGEHYAVFSCSPSEYKELTIGHLLAEGIIDSVEEIESVDVSGGRVDVHLTKGVDMALSGRPRLILTECGGESEKVPPRLWMKPRVKDATTVRFDFRTVVNAVKALNSLAETFRRTGGTHASALLGRDGNPLVFSEDIGRHNAVDKVLGKAALRGLNLKGMILASTGRLTSDMVIKAANVGIPVIVSISAPTDKGIKVAEMAGLTLIGFARGRRFNIYTHPERIEKP